MRPGGWGIGGVQAVDVAQKHQQVGMDAAGDDGGQRVIVADRGDLISGNGVVLVDDGQRTQPSSRVRVFWKFSRRPSCSTSSPVSRIWATFVVVGGEQAVVGVHQLTLAHSGAGLLGGHITGAGGAGTACPLPHADGTGRDEDDLVPCVLQVAQHLDQILCVADVQPPGGVCQRGGAHLTTMRIKLTLSHFLCLVIGGNHRIGHRAPREAVLFQHAATAPATALRSRRWVTNY